MTTKKRKRHGQRCDSFDCETAHAFHARGRNEVIGRGEFVLVRGGKRRAYLWAGNANAGSVSFVGGATTLRKLALAILDEVGHE